MRLGECDTLARRKTKVDHDKAWKDEQTRLRDRGAFVPGVCWEQETRWALSLATAPRERERLTRELEEIEGENVEEDV